MGALVAISGSVTDEGNNYTETGLKIANPVKKIKKQLPEIFHGNE